MEGPCSPRTRGTLTRTLLDRELRRWEAYATPGDFGLPNPAKIAFRCTSDAGERPRVIVFGGDKAEAERAVVELTEDDLRRMLQSAEAVG